jgi:hypothetical protein
LNLHNNWHEICILLYEYDGIINCEYDDKGNVSKKGKNKTPGAKIITVDPDMGCSGYSYFPSVLKHRMHNNSAVASQKQ